MPHFLRAAFHLAATACVLSAPAWSQQPLDLSEARIAATHADRANGFEAHHAIDGDPATFWAGLGHSLLLQPTNLVVELPQARVLSRLEVASQVFKNRLRLKRLEVYAGVGDEWAGGAPLAVVEFGEGEVTKTIELQPARTKRLRLRVRDTWRPDHAFPRINEIRLFAAPEGTEAIPLRPAPAPDEGMHERLAVAWALGLRQAPPETEFDADKGYLHYVRTFVDTMLAKGTDIYGPTRSPMFVSVLLLETQEHPGGPLPNLEGQRVHDRAIMGGNLHHDVMLLRAMDYLTELSGEAKYRAGAEAYLQYFLGHCPQATGLWPWGEHAHWDFHEERPGHDTHEFFGACPVEFWETVWRLNPKAVTGLADGIINHFVNLDNFDYTRHASISKALPLPRPAGLGKHDYPRHSGFYISLWAFAYSKTRDAEYAKWVEQALDHHWRQRHPQSGLLRGVTDGKSPVWVESELSLAVSVLEAAELWPDDGFRRRLGETGIAYLDAVAKLPHEPQNGWFVTSCPHDGDTSGEVGKSAPYSAKYGGGFSAPDGLLFCAAYRLTKDEKHLRLARALGDYYASHEFPPVEEETWAQVYGDVLGLLIDLYELTGEQRYIDAAEHTARLAIERLYWDGLFRAATGALHYESHLLVSNLVFNLIHLHALMSGSQVKVPPNYFSR